VSFPIAEYKAMIETVHETMLEHADIADKRPSPDHWTLKEMVGHLIDSACNNHQRFVRLQLNESLTFPAYDPEAWKEVSTVSAMEYHLVVNLWNTYNLFLLALVGHITPSALGHVWTDKGKNLEYLVTDYFVHLNWHLDLFRKRAAEIRQAADVSSS
jgi:hypothetical protein